MRLTLLASIPIGTVIAFAGLVGWFFHYPDAVAMVALGVGLPSVTTVAKGWQSQSENAAPKTE